jgi:phosphoribosyl-ATP pyrophosphohydrolase
VQRAHALLREYLISRGLPMPEGSSARKVAEESIELVEACSREVPDTDKVMHELADVILAATVVAEHYGFTLEQAIRAKIDLDAGRETARWTAAHGQAGCRRSHRPPGTALHEARQSAFRMWTSSRPGVGTVSQRKISW